MLKKYIEPLLEKFKDSRVVTNITELVEKMISNQTTKLWKMAEDKKEYERMRNLFNGKLKSVIDEEKISEILRSEAVEALGREKKVIVLHDPCEIRKEYAKKLENLGIVRDLDGKLINGYSTFDTVCVDENGKDLKLTDITVYSNKDKDYYVSQKEVDAVEKKQTRLEKEARKDDEKQTREIEEFTAREQEILSLIEREELVNVKCVMKTQLTRVSKGFKENKSGIDLCHILDRGFDSNDSFVFIKDELKDNFIIRLKTSRNSNQVMQLENGKTKFIKLTDVSMAKSVTDTIAKLTHHGKVYQDVKRLIEWDTLAIDEKTYSIVRISLFTREGKMIFKQPMLLLTSYMIQTHQQALEVYRFYLMRTKIEGVFKFIKNALGWEEFQIHDWVSIRNLIAFTFYLGGYFYAIEPQLAHHPVIEWLCLLGGGKGEVTRTHFLCGLKALFIYRSVDIFIQEHQDISPSLDDIAEFAFF